ncbi:hypothetical protein [Virgibacillus doumboii]|uniref:hypothetical protein n=1 Tax=Virgibacillus doumboii TaxID=2697503 RepID=UPI001FEBA6E5|nr:hypothetical protein [Virgibacillus doumboii]
MKWQLAEGNLMGEKTVYFLFTDTGTYLSRLINYVTKEPLNHVSIGFDPDLQEVYSFGRKKPRNPFIGGFVKEDIRSDFLKNSACAVYTLKLSEADIEKIKDKIAEIELRKNNYKYNFLGLIGVWLQIEINRNDALFCSQFVATVLKDVESIKFKKPVCFTTPSDIRNHKGMELIYQGTLGSYRQPDTASEKESNQQLTRKSYIFLLTKKVKSLVIK